jgi:dolichyl-phosphate beta-glucosyltransferase
VSATALCVVVPAFDESRRLGATLDRILDYLERRGGAFEVLVVDDGSRDDTAAIADGFATRGVRVIRFPVNRGKGAAVRAGILATAAERILISDADLSTPIEELERLEPALERSPIVLGSRASAQSRIERHQPFYRELAGRTFNLLVRASGVRGIRDTQCGFKLLAGEVARELAADLTIDRFAWDVELVGLAQRRGLAVEEVGVAWRNDPASKVRLVRDSLRMAWDLVRIRWRHRRSAPRSRSRRR